MPYFLPIGCGFCKKLKPDFSTAADEVKGKAVSFLERIHWFFIIELLYTL